MRVRAAPLRTEMAATFSTCVQHMQTPGSLGLMSVVGLQKMSRVIMQRNSSSNRSPLTPPRTLREFPRALVLLSF
jgi:hypothetical protein